MPRTLSHFPKGLFLIFGIILMVQLVLSFLELEPHFPRFLFYTMIQNRRKNALILMTRTIHQNPTCSSLPVTPDLWVSWISKMPWPPRCLSKLDQNQEVPQNSTKCIAFWVASYMGVSKNNGIPKSSILIGFYYKPSILGYHYFWKHLYGFMTSPLWMRFFWGAGSRLIQKLTSIGGFAPRV